VAAEKPVELPSGAREEDGRPTPLGADFIIPLLSVALIAYYSATTAGLSWEAKVTGVFIGAVLGPLCAVHMARLGLAVFRRRATLGFGDLVSNTAFNRQRFGLLALAAAFIAAIEWTGTSLGLFLLLVGCMLLMGVRSPRALLGVAITTTAVVYLLLIRLLNSRLPRGPVETLLGSFTGGQ
jgi:hypothetical protein